MSNDNQHKPSAETRTCQLEAKLKSNSTVLQQLGTVIAVNTTKLDQLSTKVANQDTVSSAELELLQTAQRELEELTLSYELLRVLIVNQFKELQQLEKTVKPKGFFAQSSQDDSQNDYDQPSNDTSPKAQ